MTKTEQVDKCAKAILHRVVHVEGGMTAGRYHTAVGDVSWRLLDKCGDTLVEGTPFDLALHIINRKLHWR